MADSQFKKRQKKTTVTVAPELVIPVKEKTSEVAAEYTQTALDIYTEDNGFSFGVAEIEYNPITKDARVKETFKISRLVALSYANQKRALGTLKKK